MQRGSGWSGCCADRKCWSCRPELLVMQAGSEGRVDMKCRQCRQEVEFKQTRSGRHKDKMSRSMQTGMRACAHTRVALTPACHHTSVALTPACAHTSVLSHQRGSHTSVLLLSIVRMQVLAAVPRLFTALHMYSPSSSGKVSGR